MRPLFQRIPEIELEEGPRAAAIADELTIDGWDPLLHIMAWMDPALTNPPRSYAKACEWTTRWYHHMSRRLWDMRLGNVMVPTIPKRCPYFCNEDGQLLVWSPNVTATQPCPIHG